MWANFTIEIDTVGNKIDQHNHLVLLCVSPAESQGGGVNILSSKYAGWSRYSQPFLLLTCSVFDI